MKGSSRKTESALLAARPWMASRRELNAILPIVIPPTVWRFSRRNGRRSTRSQNAASIRLAIPPPMRICAIPWRPYSRTESRPSTASVPVAPDSRPVSPAGIISSTTRPKMTAGNSMITQLRSPLIAICRQFAASRPGKSLRTSRGWTPFGGSGG